MRADCLVDAARVEVGVLECQHLVQHDAQRADVAARVAAAAEQPLGRHVGGRSHDLAGLGLARFVALQRLGKPEVDEHGREVVLHDDVVELEVAVHDLLPVRVRERIGELGGDLEHLDKLGLLVVEMVVEIDARDVIHGEVIDVVLHRDFVDVYDAGVRELGHRMRLGEETVHERLVDGDVRRQHLERDFAVEVELHRPVHHGHAAPVYLLDDAVFAQHRAQGQVRVLDGGKKIVDLHPPFVKGLLDVF